jgi:hypothetical protein
MHAFHHLSVVVGLGQYAMHLGVCPQALKRPAVVTEAVPGFAESVLVLLRRVDITSRHWYMYMKQPQAHDQARYGQQQRRCGGPLVGWLLSYEQPGGD